MARWLRAHPYVGDSLIAGFVFLISIPGAVRGSFGELVVALLMSVPLVVRRRHPFAVFAVVSVAAFGQWVVDIPVRSVDVAILIALYSVAAYGHSRRATLVAAAVSLGGVVLAAARWHQGHVIAALIAPTAVALVALAAGDDRRTRRAYYAGLEERAERLEAERDALAQVAASAERARIARELHDVVAHSLSVMVAQADGAAYTIDTDPTRARRAMETVGDTGRDALIEMRRLLGVLRPTDSTGERAPQPGVDQIAALVANVRDAGLPVELTMDESMGSLPPGMELAAYRIVQEALTNTIKHSGPGASARVEVHRDRAGLAVLIDDDGAGIRRPDEDGSGQGLDGMRDRASLYGGRLKAGPRPTGGFEVNAVFPLHHADS